MTPSNKNNSTVSVMHIKRDDLNLCKLLLSKYFNKKRKKVEKNSVLRWNISKNFLRYGLDLFSKDACTSESKPSASPQNYQYSLDCHSDSLY